MSSRKGLRGDDGGLSGDSGWLSGNSGRLTDDSGWLARNNAERVCLGCELLFEVGGGGLLFSSQLTFQKTTWHGHICTYSRIRLSPDGSSEHWEEDGGTHGELLKAVMWKFAIGDANETME